MFSLVGKALVNPYYGEQIQKWLNLKLDRQTLSDKVQGQKGNNPDFKLRS